MIVPTERQHAFPFEEYAQLAERSEFRVELWEGAILDMSGGSPRHSAISANVLGTLTARLRGTACRVFDANLRVRSTAANRATYADVTIVCGPLELDPNDKTGQTVLNPTVLIEVLSPSTERDDRGSKLDCYKLIGSVRVVVLVAHETAAVTVHEKQSDGSWTELVVREGEVELGSIGCRVGVGEIYERLPEG